MELIAAVAVLAAVHAVGAGESIQTAVAAAQEGDEVVVAPGVYDENIVLTGKNIVLRSTAPENPAIVASTVIDGGGRGSVLTLAGTETAACRIAGLTITNGAAENGGGINGKGAKVTVEYCVVTSNSATVGGGGIDRCDGIIRGCTVSWNRGKIAGGIRAKGANYLVRLPLEPVHQIVGCLIENNVAAKGVGGVDNGRGGTGAFSGMIEESIIRNNRSDNYGGFGTFELRNCIVYGNQGEIGGGRAERIQNCTIVRNIGTRTGGLRCYSGLVWNSIIWANEAPLYPQYEFSTDRIRDLTIVEKCVIQDWDSANGRAVLRSDPLFTSAATHDYTLKVNSPCVDSGSAGLSLYWWDERDVSGNTRWVGNQIDIGCYELGGRPDADGDYLADADEVTQGTDPSEIDSDGDGLSDGLEVIRSESPLKFTSPPGVWAPDSGSIRDCLRMAYPGETVWVRPGVYHENLIVWQPRAITISSVSPDDPATVDTTIIDGDGIGIAVVEYYLTDDSTTATLRGVCITGGIFQESPTQGGGIRCRGENLIVEDCLFRGNTGAFTGGEAIIRRCRFDSNNGDSVVLGGGKDVRDCIFSRNSTERFVCAGRTISNCVIVDNVIQNGTPVHIGGEGASIINSTIAHNRVLNSSVGGIISEGGAPIRNCIVWGNICPSGVQVLRSGMELGSVENSLIQNWPVGADGIIDADPMFVNPAAGNYEVRRGSPAIDAGMRIEGLTLDILGRPRPVDGDRRGAGRTGDGSDYDIGAYEFPTPGNAAVGWERYR